MSSCGLTAAVFFTFILGFSAAPSSCRERCGLGYSRGDTCQCDYSCILYGECCSDFRARCTTKDSCKGRCGETFKRGRLCSCDADCVKYENQCCADYKEHCDGLDTSRDADEEPTVDDIFFSTVNPTSYQQDDPDSASKQILPSPFPELSSGSPPTDLDFTTGPSLPDLDGFEIPPEAVTASAETTTAVFTEQTTPESTTAAATTDAPEPTTLMSTASPTEANTEPTQTDDDNDTDLCSGRPISGATTLSNGTVVIFRGHYFWVLSPNRAPGPARRITEFWGIPSPIDTVFSRCNCQGKTYIFKGPQYWRYENDNLDPGFPKVVETGFDGLRGHVTAALSVPQHNQRKESVYFFKRGGDVQKYSYQFGTNPSCGRRKVHYAVFNRGTRIARQVHPQVSLLEPAVNYRRSWRGFPSTITAAVSIPDRRQPDGYSYYVFNRAKSYRIRIDGNRPVVISASKPNDSTQSNEVFKCPQKHRSQ